MGERRRAGRQPGRSIRPTIRLQRQFTWRRFQINSYTTDDQSNPFVHSAADGRFVVIWDSDTQDGDQEAAFGQRFDSAGSTLGTEFQINTYTTGRQRPRALGGRPDGSFIAGWINAVGATADAVGRLYAGDGTPIGTEFQINSGGNFSSPDSIAAISDGFVISWYSGELDGDDSGVFARRYDTTANPLGTEFQVNTYTTGGEAISEVLVGPDDGFTIIWDRSVFTGGHYGQRFAPERCGPTPEPDSACHLVAPNGAGKANVGFFLYDPVTQIDRFRWNWLHGEATALSEFKSPDIGTATYRVCVYDGSAEPQPLMEHDIPAGGLGLSCGRKSPCWQVFGPSAAPLGFRYRSTRERNVITDASFKIGGTGQSRIRIKGDGELLALPPPNSLVPDVTVQLLIDDGVTTECFKTAFPGQSGRGAVKKQTATQFRASGP